jgi:hypothetical protein
METNESPLFAEIAEQMRQVCHEVNNSLNTLLLRVTLMQLELPERTHAGLAEIRQHVADIAESIKRLHPVRQACEVAIRELVAKTDSPEAS